jgi:hypothetical protein
MRIIVNETSYDTATLSYTGLIAVLQQVQTLGKDGLGGNYMKFLNELSRCVAEKAASGQLSVMEKLTFKKSSVVSKEYGYMSFFPGLSWNPSFGRDRFVEQFKKLNNNQGWAWGTFLLVPSTESKIDGLTLIGKLSVQRDLLQSGEWVFRPVFDYGTTEQLSMLAMRSMSEGAPWGVSPRHATHWAFMAVGQLFNEMYPTAINQESGKIACKIELEVEPQPSYVLAYPELEAKGMKEQERRGEKVQKQAEEASSEHDAELEALIPGISG